MKLIWIEDNPEAVEVHAARLSQAGCHVLVLSSQDVSPARIKQHAPQVIIADMMLRQTSGFSLLRTIRKVPELHQISLLACTAMADDQERDHALRQGADDFLAKPFRYLELVEKLERLFRLYEMAHEKHEETGLAGTEQFKKYLAHRLAQGEKIALCCFELAGLGQCRQLHGREAASDALVQTAAMLIEVGAAHGIVSPALGFLGGGFLGAIVPANVEQDFCRTVAWNFVLHEPHGRFADLKLLTRSIHPNSIADQSPIDILATLRHLIEGVPMERGGEIFCDRRAG